MTIGEQFSKIKDNWLLILLLLVVVVIVGSMGSFTGIMNEASRYSGAADYALGDSVSMKQAGYNSYGGSNFAPEAEERKITKSASISTEVEKGEFAEADQKLKNVVSMSGSYLLSENSHKNTYDDGKREYYTGYYTVKVDTKKYAQVIGELKTIGEVQSFNENTEDITGVYTNLETNLDVEKAKLKRYGELYGQASTIEEKTNLVDLLFNQERTVKYLEDAIKNQDTRIEYSTVSVTITEERSDYAGIAFAKISGLVRSFVGSFNSLLYLIFIVLPYAAAGGLVWLIVWFFRRNPQKAKKA